MTQPRLPGKTRLLIAGDAVTSLGTGLVLPLTLIYLHQVRGISLPLVGLLLASSAAVGLVAVPLSGALMDRFGARRVLTVVLIGQAGSEAGLALVHNVATALPVVLLFGASMGPSFPAFQTMLAGLNPEPIAQQRAFAVNFTGVNAGIGIGGAIGAAVADVSHPGSFQALFVANALSCLAFAVILSRLPNVRAAPGSGEAGGPDQAGASRPGYRDVLASRGLRTVMLAMLVLAFTGYAAMDSGLPAYATVEAHVSVHVVALSITVNTLIIVGSQLFVLRLIRRLRRSRALAAVGLIWTASWAIFGLSALPVPPGARIACVLSFMALFGVGETFMAPTIPPLVNSLADDRIRGRANALASLAYSIAFVVSPAISTGLIAAGLPALWISLLCTGCLGSVLLGARLGRLLSPSQNSIGDEALPVEPAPA